MSVKVTKSLATDFVRFNSDVFKAAVEASSIASVIEWIDADTDGDTIDSWFDVALIAADQTTFDALVAAHGLIAAKIAKLIDINVANEVISKPGFEYPASSGVFYSLGNSSRQKVIGVEVGKGVATYPYGFNSIDGLSKEVIANAVDASTFFGAALGAYQTVLDGGTVLQDTVRAAATIAAVDAVDPYNRS